MTTHERGQRDMCHMPRRGAEATPPKMNQRSAVCGERSDPEPAGDLRRAQLWREERAEPTTESTPADHDDR